MSQEPREACSFSRLTLGNWMNLAHAEVPLQRRVFLVGANASGKSNLLDAFRFLRDLASPGCGFREAVRRRGGVSSIRCLAARRHPDVMLSVTVSAGVGSPRWEYRLSFSQDNQRRPIVRTERVVQDGRVLRTRPDPDDRKDEERLSQTHLEQVNVNSEFRELVSYFESVRYLHIVPQLVREPELSLHPEIVRYLPQMFARAQRGTGKQMILSTHSPDLLGDEGIGLDEVLLLRPSAGGTTVTAAGELDEVRHLLSGGLSLADAVIPKTRPEKAEQLPLFVDL